MQLRLFAAHFYGGESMSDAELRYPIGKFQSGTPTDENRKRFLSQIEETPRKLREAVAGLSKDQLHTPYRDGGWTVQQVVHHVADSHMNAYTRFKLALTEDEPTIKPYDQEAWANLSDTKKLPVNLSITLLYSLHARWVQIMKDIDESEWQRTVY